MSRAVTLGLACLLTVLVKNGVDAQACQGGQTRSAVLFVSDATLGPAACSGYLQNPDSTPSNENLCGFLDHRAAERACWDFGGNGGPNRRYICKSDTSSAVNVVDTSSPGLTYTTLNGDGTIGEKCLNGDPDCFLDCHATVSATIDQTVTDINTQCEGNNREVAITCSDINECEEGELYDCIGPYKSDCKHRKKPCGPRAVCTNSEGSFACVCDANTGYGAGSATDFLDGCTDTDECNTPGICGSNGVCQNTPGSYICLCEEGYTWNDVPGKGVCEINSCNEPPDVDNAFKSPSLDEYTSKRTYDCEDGYEPSIAATDPFHLKCRDDGAYCSCAMPTCEKKRCGLAPRDPNAISPVVDGYFGDTLLYTCLSGFNANGDDSYTISCQADGTFETPSTRCEDTDECSDTNYPCPEHSRCYNTIGSHFCVCDPGYEDRDDNGDCDKVRCGSIPSIEHSQIITTGETSTSYGQLETVITYQCDDGYQVSYNHNPHSVVTQFELKCKQDEFWSPQPIPQCVPRSCGDPGILPFARRSGDNFSYMGQVSYTCDEGFKPSDYASHADDPTYNSFDITCGDDGMWSPNPHCIDINECVENYEPCGGGVGHLCVNKRGTYKCSCAAYYRLDETGQNCVGYTYKPAHVIEPCSIYDSLSMCNWGTCQYDEGHQPHCWCEAGYTGAFCDKLIHEEREQTSLSFMLSILGLVLASIAVMIGIIAGCCICCSHNHVEMDSDDIDHTPVYQHTPAFGLGF